MAPPGRFRVLHKEEPMFRPFRATLMLLVLLAAGPLPDALAQSSPHNPSVVPITAHYAGLTYGEWSARWWQGGWATAGVGSRPRWRDRGGRGRWPPPPVAPRHLDGTGVLAGEGQSGPVWFLAWPLVEPNAVRQ